MRQCTPVITTRGQRPLSYTGEHTKKLHHVLEADAHLRALTKDATVQVIPALPWLTCPSAVDTTEMCVVTSSSSSNDGSVTMAPSNTPHVSGTGTCRTFKAVGVSEVQSANREGNNEEDIVHGEARFGWDRSYQNVKIIVVQISARNDFGRKPAREFRVRLARCQVAHSGPPCSHAVLLLVVSSGTH